MRSRSPFGTFRVLFCLGMLVLLTGCSSSRTSVSPTPGTDRPSGSDLDWEIERVERDLRAEARSWVGVPHEWGGTDRNGIDCSAFTQILYARALGLDLPRDTKRQSRVGERVSPQALQPGDLVFFRPRGKERHVGVYLSDGDFVHASSSAGVTVSELRDSYWQRSWWQARRLIPGRETRSSPPPPDAEAASPSDPDRAGW